MILHSILKISYSYSFTAMITSARYLFLLIIAGVNIIGIIKFRYMQRPPPRRKIINAKEYPSFYVITTVFNPASYSTRYENYWKFASYIESFNISLITVEAIFPYLNQTKFQVTHEGNPHHIQVRSNSVFWMKENLINIAALRLPKEAKYICWLDSDIFFEEDDWVDKVIQGLKKYAAVQVFRVADFLGNEKTGSSKDQGDISFGYAVVKYGPDFDSRKTQWKPHPGYGWAMTLFAFRAIGGLPECNIVGGGDQHFAYALINRVQPVKTMSYDLFLRLRAEASLIHSKIKNWTISHRRKGIVGYASTIMKHRWHGSSKHRSYMGRWKIMRKFNIHCKRDMLKDKDTGLLQFFPGKEYLEEALIEYFQSRKEDK